MTPTAAPPLTVGLPVHNGAAFLPETLDALLAQTYGDYELLVSDNASTDDTEEICRAYARRDGRVRYLREPDNRGAAWNFNLVADRARGRYFKWAAHDDVPAPGYLQRCVEVLDSSPAVVLCHSWNRVIGAGGEWLWDHFDRADTRGLPPHARLHRLVWNPPTMGTSVFGVLRTDALRRTRGHGSYLSADYVVLAELALLGEFAEIPEFLFHKRFHAAMSREANRSDREAAEWFRPGSGRGILTEYWTLFFQHLAAIAAVPLTPVERARCYATFVPAWFRVWHECLVLEARRLPRQLATQARWAMGSRQR